MAVAFESGVVDSDRAAGYPGLTLTVTPNGSADQVLLVMLQLDPASISPSSVTAACNGVGMTLIHSDTAGTVLFYMFGTILGATNALQTITFTWNQTSNAMVAAAVFSGAIQTSVAAAFTNANSANGLGGASSVTVTSAPNNLVVGHMYCTSTFTSAGDTLLFFENNWPTVGPVHDSAGSYAAGATSVTLDYSSSGSWRAHGISIAAAPASYQGSAKFTTASGIAASGRLIASATATFIATGRNAASGNLITPAVAALAPAGGLTAVARPPEAISWPLDATIANVAGLQAAARIVQPFSAGMAASGVLAAYANRFTAASVPPKVQSVEERLHPEIDVHLVTHWNAQMEILVPSGTMVGRASPGRGEAESFVIDAPLKLEDNKLTIDIDALKALLGI